MWQLHVKCTSKARLDGKTAVITGCNTGLGKATAQDFFKRGCRVIMACRDIGKAEDAANEIRKETADVEGVGVIVVVRLDLSSFASVRECATQLLQSEPQINLLINNAGVWFHRKEKSKDGSELHFAVNHLGHFLLTLLLLPRILKSAPARIVNVSSVMHYFGSMRLDDVNCDHRSYSSSACYSSSKLANVLFTKELAKRLKGTCVTTYAVYPGFVKSSLFRHMDDTYFRGAKWMILNLSGPLSKTPMQGAQTTIYCAVTEEAAYQSGLYYRECAASTPSSKARDLELALRLWEQSLKWVGVEDFNPPYKTKNNA